MRRMGRLRHEEGKSRFGSAFESESRESRHSQDSLSLPRRSSPSARLPIQPETAVVFN